MNRPVLHRAPPKPDLPPADFEERYRLLSPREITYLRDYCEPVRLQVEAKKREWTATDLSDFAAGAAAGFIVGFAPFLVMLAVMVLS